MKKTVCFSRKMPLLAFFTSLILVPAVLSGQTGVNPDLKDVVIVFKTHFDNGYTDLSETVLQKYSTSLIRGALEGMEGTADFGRDQQFAWTLSGYPMKEIMHRNPAIREEVGESIRNGRIAVHALPFTFETEAMTPELLVRGFRFSSDIALSHGLELPRDAKLTDVPSHSWILPTVLGHAGVRFLHLGCNPASQSPEVPLLFWWEGPDGSRLMTMYWGGYYGTDLVPPDGWPFKSWLAIIHTNDNTGAPTPGEIRATLDKARALAPNARIRVGRMSDFYDALMQENPDLPVIRGDMPDTWIHGYLSMPKEYRDYHRTLKDLLVAESAGTINSLMAGLEPLPVQGVEEAYEDLLLFAEHTFGMAMSHGHSGIWRYGNDFHDRRAQGDYEMIEHSWKEKGDHVFQARRLALPALERELGNLAASVKAEGTRLLVYNPLPYERSGLVEIRAHSGWYGIKAIKDAGTGETVLLENKDNVYRFMAKDVPGMGYRTYLPSEQQVTDREPILFLDTLSGILENGFLRARLDTRTGRLLSVLDKATGLEMTGSMTATGVEANGKPGPPGSMIPFGGYLYQRFDKNQVEAYANSYIKGGWDWAPAELGRPNLDRRPGWMAAGTDPAITWDLSPNRISVTLLFEAGDRIPHRYSLMYTLFPGKSFLEITWAVHSKPAEPWPEAGWMAFPFNLDDPEFRVGRLGGIADPSKDFIKGSNFDYFMTHTGVALFGKNRAGFAVTSPDAPAVSLDKPGLWTWSGSFVPKRPVVFFNLFNNQWSTNFTEWIEGSWSARFYVWAFAEYDPATALVIPAGDVAHPLQGVIARGKGGVAPVVFRGVEVSQKNITVSAFAPDSVSGGYLLRLWESAGKSVTTKIRLPDGSSFRQAQPVDLRGRKSGQPIPVNNGILLVECPAFQPASLLLTR